MGLSEFHTEDGRTRALPQSDLLWSHAAIEAQRCVEGGSKKPDEASHLWGARLSASAPSGRETLYHNIWIDSAQSLYSLTELIVKK